MYFCLARLLSNEEQSNLISQCYISNVFFWNETLCVQKKRGLSDIKVIYNFNVWDEIFHTKLDK